MYGKRMHDASVALRDELMKVKEKIAVRLTIYR